MLGSFAELQKKVCQGKKYRVCIAAAEDEELLQAVKAAEDMGFIQPVLIGDASVLESLVRTVGLGNPTIVHCAATPECAAMAVAMVKQGDADVLMKGKINTSDYMRAILHKENGLRSGDLISALAVYEVKEYHKLIFCTDSGINTAPDLEAKKHILHNALTAMQRLGFTKPKVAALAASEVVSPKIPATADADALAKLAQEGGTLPCILEGPIAFDVAFDKHAAEHKGIASAISGDVDLILAPNIETGNALGKSWLTLNKASWAGAVLGATHPVVLGSRSDSAEVKINSIALSCLLAAQ